MKCPHGCLWDHQPTHWHYKNMKNDKYILDENGDPKVVGLIEWGEWMEVADRTVAKSQVGEVEVSTVFLGLDHNFGDGEPLLFETMIFGGEHDGYQERYATKIEALKGHEKALNLVEKI